jgi:toxin CcdB
MAQFDVHELRDDKRLVVNVQSDFVSSQLDSCLIIPLFETHEARWPFSRLAPLLALEGRELMLATPLMIGLPRAELGRRRGSLAEEGFTILNAIDFLLTGF